MKANAKILIVEDELIIALDLQNILEHEGYEICGIAATFDEALDIFCDMNPDIVLCDIFLKGSKTGIDFANKISLLNSVPLIFITAYSGNNIMEQVNGLQNISYITKPFTNSQVVAAVKLASYRSKNHNRFPKLSDRQEDIVLMIKKGVVSNNGIATKLGISVDTVKSHKKQLYQKFSVKNTAELVKLLFQKG
jgi:two-component system, response regulator PdtaR